MDNLKTCQKQFYDEKTTHQFKFKINDSIKILKGTFNNIIGTVISLETIKPEPTYLIETSTGKDIIMLESHIELFD
jgi:transcription antitermination factor NusG